jgi:hypothetical protein
MTINTVDRGNNGRRRMRSIPYNTTTKRNIPHHTQYAMYGCDRGEDNPKRLSSNPTGVDADAIQGTTQVAG